MDFGGDGGLSPVLDHNDGEASAPLNFSDVLEAIEHADPSFDAGGIDDVDEAGGTVVVGGNPLVAGGNPLVAGGTAVVAGSMSRSAAAAGGPYVRIEEQPASRALRFRYECEGRSAGSLPGVNSTQDRRTYPTIEICNHVGKAIVVVSCVTKDTPYRPHPHNLVGRDRCQRGVCTQRVDVTPDNRLVTFSNLGIQCVKRRDITEALRVREELRVDPFRTGYAHRNQPQSIDLNAVRLCFQVFLPDEAGKVRHSLEPVVSDVVFDKKAMMDLQILRISRCAGAAQGGTELILLCEKVAREDVEVVVYEERRDLGAGGGESSAVVWEKSATVVMVHKQVAIAFTTPAYRDPHTQSHVDVFIQLKRPSDGARSVGVPFTYIPEQQDSDMIKRKRQKTLNSTLLLHRIEQERAQWQQEQKPIKSEPSDKSPMHMTSPHHAFSPIEQVPENAYPIQHWVQEAMNMPSGNNPYYPEQLWAGNYPAASPTLPASVSPAQGQAHSPSLHVLQQVPPQGMSPQHRVVSPHAQVLSPQQQVMSPQGQVLSPQRQVMSPHGQVMSPQGQVMSPQGQVMSPQGQVNLQVLSPLMGGMDGRQCMGAVSPGMGHVSPMGSVSPNMMQQPLPQVTEMETNSTPSLTNLLNQGAELAPLQLNSEELSGLLNYPNSRPHELTDSFHQLSTMDRM